MPRPRTGSRAARPPATPASGRRSARPPRPASATAYRRAERPAAAGSLCSIRAGMARAPTSPNPPASCAGLSPRGSSSSASGLPFASARIRSRTRSSSPNRAAERSSVAGVLVRQPPDLQVRQPAELLARLARGEDQPDRFGQQPPRRERQHLRRRPVQPLRVIDHAQQRPLLRRLRQQGQHRQRRPGTGPARPLPAAPNATPSAVALGTWQAIQPVQQRRAQQMQAGEGQLHLRFHSRRPGHPHVRSRPRPRTPAAPTCPLPPRHAPPARRRVPRAAHRASRQARRALAGGPLAPAAIQVACSCPSPPQIRPSPIGSCERADAYQMRAAPSQPTDTGKACQERTRNQSVPARRRHRRGRPGFLRRNGKSGPEECELSSLSGREDLTPWPAGCPGRRGEATKCPAVAATRTASDAEYTRAVGRSPNSVVATPAISAGTLKAR